MVFSVSVSWGVENGIDRLVSVILNIFKWKVFYLMEIENGEFEV